MGRGRRRGPRRPPRIAFRCRQCHTPVGDGHYRGPEGHAPRYICLECWLGQWEQITQRMHRGGDWRQTDTLLSLLAAGYSLTGAAAVIGRDRKTLRDRLRRTLRSFDDLPDWFIRRLGALDERRKGICHG